MRAMFINSFFWALHKLLFVHNGILELHVESKRLRQETGQAIPWKSTDFTMDLETYGVHLSQFRRKVIRHLNQADLN